MLVNINMFGVTLLLFSVLNVFSMDSDNTGLEKQRTMRKLPIVTEGKLLLFINKKSNVKKNQEMLPKKLKNYKTISTSKSSVSQPKGPSLTHQEYVLAKKVNFYTELGIDQSASQNQINQAYAQTMNELQANREKIDPTFFKQKERSLQIIYLVLAIKRDQYNYGLSSTCIYPK